MTEQQRKALNALFTATLQVKEAFMQETVTYDERREALSRMLENFLITASMPQEGFIIPEVPRIHPNNSIETENLSSGTITSTSVEEVKSDASNKEFIEGTNSTVEKILIEGEKKFGINPVSINGKYAFKKLYVDEERDLDTKYPFVLKIDSNKGNFYIETDISDFNSIQFKEEVSSFISSSNAEGASKVTTVEPGIVDKIDRIWVIVKPAILKYQ